ncbi:MAG: adenylate kinase [Rhodothermales bacterium]
MRILIFGPPGAGKGTQAAKLIERFSLKHISTGNMLRAAVADKTAVGAVAKDYINEGRLVPGQLMKKITEEAIAEQGYDQFILDGYPRTVEQAEWLSEFLNAHRAPLDAVISLVVPDEVIVERLSARRVNRKTGENYHLEFKPPPPSVDPSLIYQRPDDRPEAIRKRLAIYHDETKPVESHFSGHPKYARIDGTMPQEDVHEAIVDLIMADISAAEAD